MVETHYSVDAPNLFIHDINRGDSINDLFIFNHFVTDAVLGVGLESEATVVNEYNFLMDRIIENYSLKQKFPNFVTLDFVSIGNGMQVVNDLNQNGLSTNELENSIVKVYPNPASSELHFDLPMENSNVKWKIQLLDLNGRILLSTEHSKSDSQVVNVSSFERGYYILAISSENEYFYSNKIILK